VYWQERKTTVKTLLMEVLTPSTPTYSVNYKVFLETRQDEAKSNFRVAPRGAVSPT